MKLTRLESENKQHGNRIAELESESLYIQNNSKRLNEFDSEIRSATDSIQQNSNAITGLVYMLKEQGLGTDSVLNNSETTAELGLKLTLDNCYIRTVNDTLMGIDNRITDLETKTTELDLNGQSATFLIQILNDTLEDVLQRTIELNFNNSERIHDLESSVRSVTSIAKTQNISIMDLGSQIVDLKNIQISSDIISELESDIQSAMSLINAHNATQTDIEKRITEQETASSAFQNVSDIISEFDAEFRLGISIIQAYNDTLTELGIKISVLETNLSDQNPTNKSIHDDNMIYIPSFIQEYNSSLNYLGNRVFGLEMNVSDCRGKITDFKAKVDSITSIIQISNVSLNYIGNKVDELESESTVIRNNSSTINEIHSDLDTATSIIEDHDAALQNIANNSYGR